jgi:glycosyltransferase involved in cell wall biosynthesis
MFRRMARRDNLIFVSNAVRDAHVYDAHEGAAYVVYNGVDDPNGAEDIAPYPRSQRVELGIPDDAVVIGYTAAFIGWKNHCVLLQAFAEILRGNPNVRLLLIGGGALRKPAMESAAEMGLEDRVIFTGRRRDARRLLGLMDIYAHPADGEGFGLAVVEAMLAGLPAVVTRAGALPEIVRHERNGLLVDTNDAASLAEALGRLTNDAGLRSTLGAQGRADCLERFAPSLYAHRLTEILLRTCGQEYAASAAAAVEG